MPLDPGRCVVSRRPRRWARRERLLVDSSRRDVNENSIICVYARYATADRGRSQGGYNSEIKNKSGKEIVRKEERISCFVEPKSCFVAVVVRRSCGYNSEIKNERGEMWV